MVQSGGIEREQFEDQAVILRSPPLPEATGMSHLKGIAFESDVAHCIRVQAALSRRARVKWEKAKRELE